MFSIEFWNMFHRTDAELPRTNNSMKGWHRSFQGHLPSCHPSSWKFLRVLKNEESVIRVDILQQLGGHVDSPRRARYINCNARIVRIVDDYPNRTNPISQGHSSQSCFLVMNWTKCILWQLVNLYHRIH